ncbi:MAG: M28 family peptidase [Terriglobales bacterium]
MKTEFFQRLVFVVLFVGLFASLPAAAQNDAPSEPLMIAVTDPTGAMVPHALIEVSPAPANAKEMYTGPDGKFTIHLTPGTYEVFVTAAGFRRWTRRVEVQAGASQMVGVKLSFAPNSGPIAVQCATPDCTTPASQDFDGHSWWEHIKFLADDKLEGRDTGSRGEREAEKYAVEQLKKAGAEPAGVDGFYQPVKFVSRRIVEKDSSLTLIRDGKREPLVLGEDANISSRVMPAPKVKAQLVFAGYGLKVPETSYDDFAGIDLHGKIAVILSGSPSQIPGALASHYQTMAERWKSLRAAGAIGVVSLINPASMDIPWSRIALNRNHPSMALDYPEFNETEGDQLAVLVNPASAEKLFAGSGHTFAEIAALGKDRLPMPHFALAKSLEAKTKVEVTRVESANIVAKLPGSDPALKDEYVVLSAHIDHIGIGEPINGDRIYNGAMDNGSGSALVLDMAESFKEHPEKLRRSILLVLVTGEEKGLLGSKYFAAHPTVPPKSMVADINVDMFLPIVPLKVLTVEGLAESDLGDEAREVAQSLGVKVQPDPEPLRNVFIRSDQYNFIRHGVPSIMMDVGAEPGSPETKIFKDWLTMRYHAPSDDVNQPVDLATAARYEEIVRALLIKVANDSQRPHWKSDSFFRRFAEGN